MYSTLNSSRGLSAAALAFSIVFVSPSFADDGAGQTPEARFEKAHQLFAQRSATDPAPIDQALKDLAALEHDPQDSDTKYKVLILESRAFYWKGQHVTSNDEKMDLFAQGQQKADDAVTLNERYAEGYYYAGINLARWGEAKGIIQSLFKKDQLIKYMNQAIDRSTMDGQDGESIDGFGPHRVFGRMYQKLPSLFGGSHSESVKHLDKAYNGARNVALNVVYFAETLNAGNQGEKAQARKILDELLTHTPEEFNDRIPESKDEFAMAQKLRKEIG